MTLKVAVELRSSRIEDSVRGLAWGHGGEQEPYLSPFLEIADDLAVLLERNVVALQSLFTRLDYRRRPARVEEVLILGLQENQVSFPLRSLGGPKTRRRTRISSKTISVSCTFASRSFLNPVYFFSSRSKSVSNHSTLTSPVPAERWIELASLRTSDRTSSRDDVPLADS